MSPERRLSFLGTAWLVTRKDLVIEFRSREVVFTTLFFAVSCVLVFAFGFVRDGVAVDHAAAGILWIAIAFSGTLALGRAFERERGVGRVLSGVLDINQWQLDWPGLALALQPAKAWCVDHACARSCLRHWSMGQDVSQGCTGKMGTTWNICPLSNGEEVRQRSVK